MNGTAIVVEREPGVAEPRPQVPQSALDPHAALVAQLRRADAAAAEALVDAYGDRVYRLASRITGHASDAEEVVQDALWTVVRKIDTFRGESAFGSWLYRIAANAAYQKVRGRRRRPEVPLDDVLPSARDDGHHAASIAGWSPTVDDPSRQADLRLALTAALNALPADYRAAVVLRDIEEFSIAEVAELLGLSVANVKSRVHRARLFLRQRLTVSLATSRESAQERTAPTRSWRRRLAESPPVRGGRNAWSPSRRRTPKGAATACPCASRHPVPRREPAYRKSWLKEASMTR